MAEVEAATPVRPMIVILGGRLTTARWPAEVTVMMHDALIATLRAFPAVLAPEQAAAVYALARRDTTWNPHP
jgi:hypothetical protein